MDSLDLLFVASAFLFQTILIIHFALRKWRFDSAMRFGPVVYALGVPAAAASLILLSARKPWSLWLAGFLFLAWAIYGYIVDYVRKINWRTPLHWPVAGPYLTLYLATIMFYWFPLGNLSKPLWYLFALLFVANTYLNVTSHRAGARLRQAPS